MRYRVDIAGEENPELAPDGNADGHSDDRGDRGDDRSLPGDGGGQLPGGESEGLQ